MGSIAAITIAAFAAYVLYVMIYAIFYAAMTCSSAFAGAYFLSCVTAPDYSIGLSSADMTGIALLCATIYFSIKFRSSFSMALSRLW